MAEAGVSRTIPASSATSPPPNCAICLGTCTNKCFSDSCMHQFCFTCLLEWSKVKAECPLCKQHFTSIIHNVKSNNEFDEYVVEPSIPSHQDIMDDYLYLPTPAQPSRHFQFRTTFTVDPRGELAIQQMLLTHRLTNSSYSPNYNYNYRNSRHRHRRDVSSTSFRRSIYQRNLWVSAPPDITGRYRNISPQFYRENPAAINRLVPWLNRELNALLEENTQQVMMLVDMILGRLTRHHIRGYSFTVLLREYLGSKTEHFVHEFYNFMRSPYDMVGYDRNVTYFPGTSMVYPVPGEDDSEDSDVAVVGTNVLPTPNPFHRPTLEVIEINSDSSRDSDVIIHEPPPPVVVDLVNTSDDDDDDIRSVAQEAQQENVHVETKWELSDSDVKPRLSSKKEKRAKEKYEKSRRKRKVKSSRYISSSSESDSSSSTSSDSENYKHHKKRRKPRMPKKSSATGKIRLYLSSTDDTTDDEPLSEKVKKLKDSRKSKRKDKIKTSHRQYRTRKSSTEEEENKASIHKINDNHQSTTPPLPPGKVYPSLKNSDITAVASSSLATLNPYQDQDNKYDSDKPLDFSMAAFAGPSYRNGNSSRGGGRYQLWYSRPCAYESDSSTSTSSD